MTPNDTDARDIVARCEDALKRRDMLLEHKLLQEAVREMRATRAERDALRERDARIAALEREIGLMSMDFQPEVSDDDAR